MLYLALTRNSGHARRYRGRIKSLPKGLARSRVQLMLDHAEVHNGHMRYSEAIECYKQALAIESEVGEDASGLAVHKLLLRTQKKADKDLVFPWKA
jgi:hypothetical protein